MFSLTGLLIILSVILGAAAPFTRTTAGLSFIFARSAILFPDHEGPGKPNPGSFFE
jgi:hypothetical protein